MTRRAWFLAALTCGACGGPASTEQSNAVIQVAVTGLDALTTAAQLTKVSASVTPAAVMQDLTLGAADRTVTGTISVPAGTQTVTIDVFASTSKVATGTSSPVALVAGQIAVVSITVLDTTGSAARPPHPVITSLIVPNRSVFPGDAMTLHVAAIDPAGGPLGYQWNGSPAGCAAFSSTTVPSPVWTAVLSATCTISCTVTDAEGLSDSRSVDVTVFVLPDPYVAP